MKKLTLRKTIKLHRELWIWLAEHPDKSKDEWPRWEEIEAKYGSMDHRCFACKYCGHNCFECPFDWTNDAKNAFTCVTFWGMRKPGLYSLYCDCREYDQVRLIIEYAYRIATLPLKRKYKLMYIFMPWK